MKQLALLILLAALAISCGSGGGGGESPTTPTPTGTSTPIPTFDGVYEGSATGPPLNLTNFLLTATVSSGVITGTLRSPEGAGQIPLSGTASAAGEVTMTATDNCGGARYTLNGSLRRDSAGFAHITGTWSQPAAAGCPGASGTFTMTRGATVTFTTFPSGTWVGTLSRPEGDPLSATWVATRGPALLSSTSGSFDGPLTLAYRGVTVTARLFGSLGGSNTAVMGGYQFNFAVEMAQGASSAVPNCRISSSGDGGITNNLRDSSSTITTAVFSIFYANCRGFVDPTTPAQGQQERAQLVLNKQ